MSGAALTPAPDFRLGPVLGRIETALRVAVAIPTAVLVVVEIAVLLAGVVSRFVFHHPVVWSDELASILFLWLAMFGAVVALQRGEHMRLTALVSGMSARWRPRAEALAVAVPTLFLALMLPWARDYAADQSFIETPPSACPTSCAREPFRSGLG